MLRQHRQRLGLLFVLRFHSWAFAIDSGLSRRVFLLTVPDLRRGRGE